MTAAQQTTDGATLAVTAAYDGSPITELDQNDVAAVTAAMATADALFHDRGQWLALPRRIEILRATAEIMRARFEDLAVQAAREGGKPLIDSRVEIDRAIDGVEGCVEVLRSEGGEVIPMGLNASSAGRVAFTRHEPIGPVVSVSAFNHPMNLIVHQVAPAVATGCPVVVKPAADTPLSGKAFVEILHEAGLPPEWCQLIVTDRIDVAEALVTDPRVAFFSFIGSARVGWMLRAKLAPGARCALEHGGAAPVIVAADADLADSIPRMVKGGFYHAGQVCVSVQRVFAHADIAESLAGEMAAQAGALRVGDPTSADTDVGPLIRPGEVTRVAEWVREATDGGARLLCGGERISETCYAPTVLYDPPADARVSTAEIFGPVVCVTPYTDIDAAIARANGLPYAFQSSVFTRDIDTAMRAYALLESSAVMVNDHTAFRVDWMPFAGLRQSGLGVGGIPHTLNDMRIQKMMVLRSDEL
ncbi:MAG: aldehyde dehydrogenase family protein [Alphaproteobacteria bacterium]|jgi:acyl-CoA reductase-like NAD-dependent aldehyde dehydrogenase|nr:aldehyde dehydrogenase family protein [Alphaproteobacteria bacterium]MDP6515973.1 aldehyde dehydrogenase family protein [Alphaproteobacteria bacterium]